MAGPVEAPAVEPAFDLGAVEPAFAEWNAAMRAEIAQRVKAERLVLIGLVVVCLGPFPFAAAGFPFATDGFFDRGNLFADLGTALLIAAALSMLWRTILSS